MINFRNIAGQIVHIVKSDVARDVSLALKFTANNKRWYSTATKFKGDLIQHTLEYQQIDSTPKEKLTEEQKEKARNIGKILLEMEDQSFEIQKELLVILGISDIQEELSFPDIDIIYKLVTEKEQGNQAPKI